MCPSDSADSRTPSSSRPASFSQHAAADPALLTLRTLCVRLAPAAAGAPNSKDSSPGSRRRHPPLAVSSRTHSARLKVFCSAALVLIVRRMGCDQMSHDGLDTWDYQRPDGALVGLLLHADPLVLAKMRTP